MADREPERRITASKEQVERFATEYRIESESEASIQTDEQRARWIADRVAQRLNWQVADVYLSREGWFAEFRPEDGAVWGNMRML